MILILAIPFVSAEKTVKTIEDRVFFANNIAAGATNYYQVNVSTPDGISEISDATFYVIGDVKVDGDVAISIRRIGGPGGWVNCIPNEYTNFGADLYRYDMYFDCSNVISNVFDRGKELYFNVSLAVTDKNLRKVTGIFQMTYHNNPKV